MPIGILQYRPAFRTIERCQRLCQLVDDGDEHLAPAVTVAVLLPPEIEASITSKRAIDVDDNASVAKGAVLFAATTGPKWPRQAPVSNIPAR
ncbi:hypothetical protein X742_33020 [Mesorhizobium sp. LNHC232B00]|nr:hypothetical protein X742_33020 [Mesorhizobium sp. LNHC232B00]